MGLRQKLVVLAGFVVIFGALGLLWLRGRKLEELRRQSAVVSATRLHAEQGDAKAQFQLCDIYYRGQLVPKDNAEAFRWCQKAADQGDAAAQQSLGFMYYSGEGVQRDDIQAVAWYEKAAEQGDTEAQQSLAYMYAVGRGVPQDSAQAVRWYRKAADKGNPKAKRALESLGIGSKPPMRTRYFEISVAFLGFPVGLWFSLDFLFPGRKLRDLRQVALTLLGIDFLVNSALSVYASLHDIRYCSYYHAFHLARNILSAAAILIIVTILSARKKPNALPRAT